MLVVAQQIPKHFFRTFVFHPFLRTHYYYYYQPTYFYSLFIHCVLANLHVKHLNPAKVANAFVAFMRAVSSVCLPKVTKSGPDHAVATNERRSSLRGLRQRV